VDAKRNRRMHWRFDAERRRADQPVIGQLRGDRQRLSMFSAIQRNVYALDAASGKLQWKMNVEQHPRGVG